VRPTPVNRRRPFHLRRSFQGELRHTRRPVQRPPGRRALA